MTVRFNALFLLFSAVFYCFCTVFFYFCANINGFVPDLNGQRAHGATFGLNLVYFRLIFGLFLTDFGLISNDTGHLVGLARRPGEAGARHREGIQR